MTIIKRTAAIIAAAVMAAAPIAESTPFAQFAASAGSIAAAEDSTDILLDCSSRYGYEFLKGRPNGEGMQKLYDMIWDESVRLWNAKNENVPLGKNLCETGLRISLSDLDIPQSAAEDTVRIFRNDNPIFFWISGNAYFEDGKYIYTVERDDGQAVDRVYVQDSIEKYVKKTYNDAWAPYQTIKSRAKSIRDTILEKTDDLGHGSSDYRDYGVYGAVIDHRACSEGFARTYQLMLNYADIDNCYFLGNYEGHDQSVNTVRLDDGNMYYVDVELDAPEHLHVHSCGSKFFAKGTHEFLETHRIYAPSSNEDPNHFQAYVPSIPADNYPDNILRRFYRGDANMDEKLNVTDITLIAAHVKGKKQLSNHCQIPADVNKDGKINVTDIALVAAHVKGLKKIDQGDYYSYR